MSSSSGTEGLRVVVLGATGLVGEELLQVLGEREFPVGELRCFASGADGTGPAGPVEVEFRGADVSTAAVDLARVADADLVFCAAPLGLEGLLDEIRARDAALVDLSGTLELDPAVPVWPFQVDGSGRWVAIPRGIDAGVGLALRPLSVAESLERITVVSFESASTAGRRGMTELSDQTLHLLREMTGDPGGSEVFAEPLAFDCLPEIGARLDDGETTSERRLRHVLRRFLQVPDLVVESTRVRVPVFAGALASVHATFENPVDLARVRDLWGKSEGLTVLPESVLPTPRRATGSDEVWIGRVRSDPGSATGLAFVVCLDNLRRGAALAAVEAAEALCACG